MLNIAVCDDEELWRENTAALLTEYFEKYTSEKAKIRVFGSGEALMSEAEENAFDIYILDVVMPGLSGIETGMKIRKNDIGAVIIYLTTSKEYAVDSYNTNAFFYALKPVDKAKFFEVLGRAIQSRIKQKSKSITVKTKDGTVRLLLDDIYYVELQGKNLCYHLCDAPAVKSTSTRVSFTDAVIPLLKDDRFTKCGASFVINLFYVKSVGKDSLLFTNGEELSVPKNACGLLRSQWLDYWFEGGAL